MEPEFELLEGVVVLLRLLGEAHDGIEPAGIATLAHCSGEAVEKLKACWRDALGELREPRSVSR
jgi:hypothetical protein